MAVSKQRSFLSLPVIVVYHIEAAPRSHDLINSRFLGEF